MHQKSNTGQTGPIFTFTGGFAVKRNRFVKSTGTKCPLSAVAKRRPLRDRSQHAILAFPKHRLVPEKWCSNQWCPYLGRIDGSVWYHLPIGCTPTRVSSLSINQLIVKGHLWFQAVVMVVVVCRCFLLFDANRRTRMRTTRSTTFE